MSQLRAGLIGFGAMGRHHARVLSSLDGVEFVGVVDPASEQRLPPGRPLLRSVKDVLDLGIDYCVVAVPTVLHEEIGLALADAGIHALVEKPLATDSVAALRVAEAFEQRGLVGAVGHIERFNPALQQARRRMAEGQLGQVLQIATRRQGPFPARIADVGVVKDLATHDIDLTAWIAQSAFVSVAAATAYRSGREHEDLVSAVGRLADGTVTNHLVNWLSPLKERVTMITGEKGAFVADTLSMDLTFYENGIVRTEWDDVARFRGVSEGDVVRYAIAKPEPLRMEHESFRDAILGLESEIVTMREGMATVSVAEAMLESARTGESVEVAALCS
jgi:predicted dehydrogenase